MAKPKTEPTDYPHDDNVRGVDVEAGEDAYWYPAYGETKLILRVLRKMEDAPEMRDDHKIFGAKDDV